MRPASAKAKGRRLQQWVLHTLQTFFGWNDDDARVAIMGESGVDVPLISERAREQFPFSIECKNTERISIWDAIAQAEANAREGTIPMVVFKRNRSKTYAVVEFERLLPQLKGGFDR